LKKAEKGRKRQKKAGKGYQVSFPLGNLRKTCLFLPFSLKKDENCPFSLGQVRTQLL